MAAPDPESSSTIGQGNASLGWPVILLALAKFGVQFGTAGQYGIFRDELYYLDCARHLDWGYVDHPPLIAAITWVAAHLFGTSLYGLRLLPAMAGAGLVVVTALIARELGGGKFAQALAGFAVIPVPIYLMLSHWLTMNAFEPLLWMLVVWLSLRMTRGQDPRLWLWIGLLAGIGLENKYSMALPIGAMLIALLLTPQRRLLACPWFLAASALGLLAFLPNLIWLSQHGWPFLEFEGNARLGTSQMSRPPLAFVADQMLIMNPLLAPLWLGGLVWLLLGRASRPARFLGWFCLAVFLPLLILRAKNYYLSPLYPVMLAAGAVGFEALTRHGRHWLRGAYIAATLAAGLALAPFVLPLLPIERFLAYQSAFGGFEPVVVEHLPPHVLPQHFADEFGWEAMAQETAKIYAALPADKRDDTAIFANNYGEAGAIDFFGPNYGLPPAISNHVSFWLWGPRDYSGKSVIVLGSDGRGDREHFASVEAAGRVENRLSRAEEQFDIFLCRDLTSDLRDLWPAIKRWRP